MLLFAIQIYQIFGLLTFSRVLFYYNNETEALNLEISLVDENLQLVQTKKLLLLESNPISYIAFYPSLTFNGNLTLEMYFPLKETYFLILSCDDCETITTNSIYNDLISDPFIEITPISTSISAYEEIEIQYYFLLDGMGLAFYNYLLLINKEIFHYEINSNDKIFIVIFYSSGEKHLSVYFDSLYSTYISCISIIVPIISYNSIEFLVTFVKFI